VDTQTKSSDFQRVLEDIEALPIDDQMLLIQVIRQRLIQHRRSEIFAQVAEAREAYRTGDVRRGTVEELPVHFQDDESHQQEVAERRKHALEVARTIARLLREEFGATRVVAFGSLTDDAWFGARSDIDLAAWGIPDDQFYRAVATATGLSPVFEVDLVDAASCRRGVHEAIERDGIEL